jgi:DNA polymerase/3'-5' exonuclease PolX
MGGALVDGKRVPWEIAHQNSEELINEIEQRTGGWLFVGGSIARGDSDCGDIDAVFMGGHQESYDLFDEWCEENEFKTNRKIRRGLYNDMQVDFWIADDTNLVTMIQFVNGSGWFNGALRSHAKRQGMKLSQLGLFKGEDLICGRPGTHYGKEAVLEQEQEIFDALGFNTVPLQERTCNDSRSAFILLAQYKV